MWVGKLSMYLLGCLEIAKEAGAEAGGLVDIGIASSVVPSGPGGHLARAVPTINGWGTVGHPCGIKAASRGGRVRDEKSGDKIARMRKQIGLTRAAHFGPW